MERRIHLYVSRKNVLTWLMALCLVGSAVARIAFPGLKGSGDSLEVWSQIVLPVAATLLYVLIALLNGKEQFYKTAIPVWMYAVYYSFVFSSFGFDKLIFALYVIALIFIAVIYTQITSGREKLTLVLIPLLAVCILKKKE